MGASLDKAQCPAECLPFPMVDETYSAVELLDGRSLAFREYGDPNGTPVIFYHGSLSSRLFMPAWDETQEAAVAAGARIIAVDRPGYGHSSAHDGRAYMDNGAELRALLAGLNLGTGRRVALLGHQSGAPNALAAAYVTRVPGMVCQVAAVGLVSPEGPRLELGRPPRGESGGDWTGHSGIAVQATAQEAAAAVSASFDNLRAACEDLWEAWPDRSRFLAADLSEATRQGLGAAEQDYLLERSPWDFQLEDVDCKVVLWQGLESDSMPRHSGPPEEAPAAAMARHLAARLPDCTATFVRGENHLLVRRRWDDILVGMVEQVRVAERSRLRQGGDQEDLSPAHSRSSSPPRVRSPSPSRVRPPVIIVEPGAAEAPSAQSVRPLRLEVPLQPKTPGGAPPLLETEPRGPPTPKAALA